MAVTGEIDLQGNITAVGGIENKFIGGIRSGIKTFLYPKENKKEFENFMNKYNNKPFLENIEFIEICKIEDVFKIILCN